MKISIILLAAGIGFGLFGLASAVNTATTLHPGDTLTVKCVAASTATPTPTVVSPTATPTPVIIVPTPTPTAVPTATPVPIAGAASVRFDKASGQSTGAYLYRPVDDNVTDLTTAWTLEGWVKSPDWNADAFNIGIKGAVNELNMPVNLQITWNTLAVNYFVNWTKYEVAYPVGSSDNQWHHMAATYEARVLRLYWDGKIVATSGTLAATPVGNDRRWMIAGGHNSDGSMDGVFTSYPGSTYVKEKEVRLWSIRRTDAQIAAYMNYQAIGNEPGLVGAWHFNGDFRDASANAFDMLASPGISFDTNDYPVLVGN